VPARAPWEWTGDRDGFGAGPAIRSSCLVTQFPAPLTAASLAHGDFRVP
jgi:hypothetical protein